VVTGSAGALKVRPHAELSSLDVVSVLFFDTPGLTRTDPPAVPVASPLSPVPEEGDATPATPTASVEPLPADSPIKHAGAADGASPGEGVAQAQP
jgi:hypothetical protein